MIGGRVHAAILAAVAAGAIAGSACHDGTGAPAGGAASDGPNEATEDGALVSAAASEDSTTATPQDGGTSSPGPSDGGPGSPSDARVAVDSASDSGRADGSDAASAGGCGPLPHGADVVPVLLSTTGMTVPMPAGGVIASGTYILTSATSYANPIFGSMPCGTTASSYRATYRFTASSATTGILQEDLGWTYAEAGVTTSLFAASYVADVDAGSALLEEVCPVDAGSGSIGALAYTVTPTGLTVFSASAAGARVMCTTVESFAKQ
jgi:hypothetical protein